MIRTLLMSLALASIVPSLAVADDKPAPTKPAPDATGGFPIPKDAGPAKDAPGGGGKIMFYEIPRGRDVVFAEVKAALKAGGWTLDKDGGSPSGRAIRIEVSSKDGKHYKASFTGDDTRTALILTLP